MGQEVRMGYCDRCQSAGSVNQYGYCEICGTEHKHDDVDSVLEPVSELNVAAPMTS